MPYHSVVTGGSNAHTAQGAGLMQISGSGRDTSYVLQFCAAAGAQGGPPASAGPVAPAAIFLTGVPHQHLSAPPPPMLLLLTRYGPALRDVDPAAFEQMRLVVGYYDLPEVTGGGGGTL